MSHAIRQKQIPRPARFQSRRGQLSWSASCWKARLRRGAAGRRAGRPVCASRRTDRGQSCRASTSKVIAARADIGFCQDPDADRLAIIDETGRYIGEEYTLAICVDHILRQRQGPVVTNCATSRMTQDLAEKHGVPFFRSAVGEANVVDEMLAQQCGLWRRRERRPD